MARRYPPELRETIWALMVDGTGTADILREVNDGMTEPMPRRTLNDHMAALRRDRGQPAPVVKPGEETDVAAAIVRALLTAVQQTQLRITETAKIRTLKPSELETAGRAARVAQEIQKREADTARARTGTTTQAARAGASPKPVDPLEELRRRHEISSGPQPEPPPSSSTQGREAG